MFSNLFISNCTFDFHAEASAATGLSWHWNIQENYQHNLLKIPHHTQDR